MMYFWKCWRDTRAFFAVFLIIAAIVMPVAALLCKGKGSDFMNYTAAEAFLSTFTLIAISVALALGALCSSEEFAGSAVHFLFTKPRSRAYFVWATWTVGLLELLAVVALNFLVGWATFAHYTEYLFYTNFYGHVTARSFGVPLIACLLIYCLTYALTTVLRNGLRGLGASMAIVFGLPMFVAALRFRWNIKLPLPPAPIGTLPAGVSNAVWILFGLLFVLAAQLVVERAEM